MQTHIPVKTKDDESIWIWQGLWVEFIIGLLQGLSSWSSHGRKSAWYEIVTGHIIHLTLYIYIWLVVYLPLWKIMDESSVGMILPNIWKVIKHVPVTSVTWNDLPKLDGQLHETNSIMDGIIILRKLDLFSHSLSLKLPIAGVKRQDNFPWPKSHAVPSLLDVQLEKIHASSYQWNKTIFCYNYTGIPSGNLT